MDNLESRVTDLEIQISYQTNLLDELNSIIINQQSNISELEQFKKLIMQELRNYNIGSDMGLPSTLETKPPHY